MDGIILTDLPGRLRIRFKPHALTPKDYVRLQGLLKQLEDVEGCSYNALTRGLLVLYSRDTDISVLILEVVSCFEPTKAGLSWLNHLPEEESIPPNPTWGHLVNRFILPQPLGIVINGLKAIPHFLKGLVSVITGRLNVEVLDAAALLVCFLRRDFRTAGTLLFFFSLSHFLEMWTKNRTRAGLFRSLAEQMEKVWIKTEDGSELLIAESELQVNSLVVIRAGGLIPVDGIVEDGEAMVNQASMTGEALPVRRIKGGSVFAGTSVEEGEIVVKALKVGGATRVSSIVRYIEESEASKAGVQGRAEGLADSIVPFSFALSAVVYLFTGNLLKAGTVLLVDYSCAIRLSTPLAVLTAMRQGNEKGLLIKGGRYLEELAAADTAVFDKTGTLTLAKPQVEAVLPFGDFTRTEALRLAACLEEHFPHPVGRAVVKAAQMEGLNHEEEHAKVNYVVAHGISSTWRGLQAVLGSRHFVLEDNGINLSPDESAAAKTQAEQGYSVLYLAVGERLAALIAIKDELRPEVGKTLEILRADGVKRTIMLTGDLDATAAAVARETGFTEYRSQMLPDEKAKFVEDLTKDGERVMMVGDGLNDSAALARAHVGISLGDSSALAKDVANVLLLNGNLSDLQTARTLGCRTMRRIKTNYWLIVSFNTVFLGLGLFGLAGPGFTAFLHNATTAWVAWRATRPYLLENSGEDLDKCKHEDAQKTLTFLDH